jgi:hypothetical protein
MRDKITQIVEKVSGQVARSVAPASVSAPAKTTGRPDPAQLRARMAQCASEKNIDELVSVFADLSEVPAKTIWDLVRQSSDEGLMILGKACGLGWPDMHKVLAVTMRGKVGSEEDSQELYLKFANLSPSNAQRAVRFIRTNSSRKIA